MGFGVYAVSRTSPKPFDSSKCCCRIWTIRRMNRHELAWSGTAWHDGAQLMTKGLDVKKGTLKDIESLGKGWKKRICLEESKCQAGQAHHCPVLRIFILGGAPSTKKEKILCGPHISDPTCLLEIGEILPLSKNLGGRSVVLSCARPLLVLAINAQGANLLSKLTGLFKGLGALLTREVVHIFLQGSTSF